MTFDMTDDDLRIIGIAVGGTFYREEEGDLLVFSSHTFPAHRITVRKADALQHFADYCQLYTD